MIGKPKSQLSLLDSAFSKRKKRSRSDRLLQSIDTFVDWNRFEQLCEPMYKRTTTGHPSVPIVTALKCLVLQYLYDLSDPALEDALIDRLSFQRFTGISFESEIPDYSTIWRFRERLIRTGLLDTVFDEINRQLNKKNMILKKGTLVDATLVQGARKQPSKNDKEKQNDNDSPRMKARQRSQRDTEATATKKGKKWYYGYKGHIGVDQGSGIIRKYRFTTANVHDSTEREALMSGDEKALFGDKAYADNLLKRECRAFGIYYGILDKRTRNRPELSTKQKKLNKIKNTIRAQVERPFSHFKRQMGFRQVRYVNRVRNELHFMFLCLIENIRTGIALSTPGGG